MRQVPRDSGTNDRTIRWVAIAVVGIVGLALALLRAPGGNVDRDDMAGRGRAAPDIALTDFDGDRLWLSDYRGKPLVVNFWASWCPSCAAEMPAFAKIHRETDGRVAFLGINASDARESAEDLATETGVTYRLAEDPRGEAFQAFGAPGMPTTVFIDASGNVADVVAGQLSEGQLRDYISESLGVDV